MNIDLDSSLSIAIVVALVIFFVYIKSNNESLQNKIDWSGPVPDEINTYTTYRKSDNNGEELENFEAVSPQASTMKEAGTRSRRMPVVKGLTHSPVASTEDQYLSQELFDSSAVSDANTQSYGRGGVASNSSSPIPLYYNYGEAD